MEFIVNSYKGLIALARSFNFNLKAEIKFSDEKEPMSGFIAYSNGEDDKKFTDCNGYEYIIKSFACVFIFAHPDSCLCTWCSIEPLLFMPNNPEKYEIEYIKVILEDL